LHHWKKTKGKKHIVEISRSRKKKKEYQQAVIDLRGRVGKQGSLKAGEKTHLSE